MSKIHQVTQLKQDYIEDLVTFMSVNAFSGGDMERVDFISRDQSTICRFEPNDWTEILNYNLNRSYAYELK